jgi:hypothetical protein
MHLPRTVGFRRTLIVPQAGKTSFCVCYFRMAWYDSAADGGLQASAQQGFTKE